MDPAREAEYREGGTQSQGHRKGFSLTLAGGWEICWLGSLGKKRLRILVFGPLPVTSGIVEHPMRTAHDIHCLLKKNAFLTSLAVSPDA